MSMQHQEEITCPACQTKGNFTVWDRLDIQDNPEMKDSIASLEVFQYHCPHCGATVNVDYGSYITTRIVTSSSSLHRQLILNSVLTLT